MRQRVKAERELYATRRKLIGTYLRLQSFLTSFLFIFSGDSNLESLTEQMRLWRTSRAIALAMLILAYELYFSILAYPLLGFQSDVFRFSIARFYLRFALVIVGMIIVTAISLQLASYAYRQMSYTLFGLVYAAFEKQNTDAKDQVGTDGVNTVAGSGATSTAISRGWDFVKRLLPNR
jgi:hypothetical protein